MDTFRNTLIVLLLGLLLFGCNSMPPKHVEASGSEDKIQINTSKYYTRLIDNREEYEKITRIEKINEVRIQLLGDDVFVNSPLNEIAASLARWFRRNPGLKIQIESLRIYYGEDLERGEFVLKESPLIYGGVLDHLIASLIVSLADHASMPGGYSVVVQLRVVVDGQSVVVQHAQSPIAQSTPQEMVAAALNYTGYKLSQQLLHSESAK
jgi:hypothetical protein